MEYLFIPLGIFLLLLITWIIDKINLLSSRSDPLRETGRVNPNRLKIGDTVDKRFIIDSSHDPTDSNSWITKYYKITGWFDNHTVELRQIILKPDTGTISLSTSKLREPAKYLRSHTNGCRCHYCTNSVINDT